MNVPERIAERYVLTERLAPLPGLERYRGVDERLRRNVEVNLIAESEEAAQARVAAIGAAGRVAHPALARIFDAGTVDGRVFVVTEPAEGGTLADALREDQPRNAKAALSAVHDIGGALAALHDAGLVHGQVTPEVIRLDLDGRARLLFLGGPLPVESDVRWIAPEVKAGQRVTPAAEVYALGAILHGLLTGEPPADDVDVLGLNPGLTIGVARIVARATASVAAARPSGAIIAAEAEPLLARALQDTQPLPTEARAGAARPQARWSRDAVVAPPVAARDARAMRMWIVPLGLLLGLLLIAVPLALGLRLPADATAGGTPAATDGRGVPAGKAAGAPVVTPRPFTQTGRVDGIEGDKWVVAGQEIIVPFRVSGNPRPGVSAEVKGIVEADGRWVAKELRWQP